jgi:hypothetical protein
MLSRRRPDSCGLRLPKFTAQGRAALPRDGYHICEIL